MGIHDREYYRDDRRDWGPGDVRAVLALLAATVGVFVVQLFSSPGGGQPDALLQNGAFVYPLIATGELWRLVTSFFVHDPRTQLAAVIVGMAALYWFGTDVEEVYGTRRFAWFYLLAGVFVSGGKVGLAALGLDPRGWSAGAAGPVFATLTLFALHFPSRQILLMFIIPVPVGLLVLLSVVAYGLLFAVSGGSKLEAAVPLLGAAFGAAYYKLADTGPSARRREARARPKLSLRPADPLPEADDDLDAAPSVAARPRAGRPDEYLEARLDAVLEKMSRSGRDSLTPEEHEVLLKASEVYRQKGK